MAVASSVAVHKIEVDERVPGDREPQRREESPARSQQLIHLGHCQG